MNITFLQSFITHLTVTVVPRLDASTSPLTVVVALCMARIVWFWVDSYSEWWQD